LRDAGIETGHITREEKKLQAEFLKTDSVLTEKSVFSSYKNLAIKSLASVREEAKKLAFFYAALKKSGTTSVFEFALAQSKLKKSVLELRQRICSYYSDMQTLGIRSYRFCGKGDKRAGICICEA